MTPGPTGAAPGVPAPTEPFPREAVGEYERARRGAGLDLDGMAALAGNSLDGALVDRSWPSG